MKLQLDFQRAAMPGERLGVDRENGIITGAQVMRLGPITGHGCYADSLTLDQAVIAGNAAPNGLKARWEHPSLSSPTLGTYMGRQMNFRRDGDVVRADLHLYEKSDPKKREHVLNMAQDNPDMIGQSACVACTLEDNPDSPFKNEDGSALPVLRIQHMSAVDIVDQGAATSSMFAEPVEGIELSARTIAELKKALDNPEFLERALTLIGDRTGIDAAPAPAPAMGERERVQLILAAAKGKPYLNETTKEYPEGFLQFALANDMEPLAFMQQALAMADKAAKLAALHEASDEIPVESCDFESKAAPRGATLSEQYYKRFLSLGYNEQQARSMATEAANK